MTVVTTISVEDLRRGLLTASARVVDARDELCALDALAGDGDLGVTLATGFRSASAALENVSNTDVGGLFKQVGLQLAQSAPSTMGALLGGAFVRLGQEFDGVEELEAGSVTLLLESAADSVAQRGGAQPGERTVLDAMSTAAAEARGAAQGSRQPLDVLRQGAAGAVAGATATAEMEPRHGRAAWIAERARGHQDAGARAWAIFLGGLVDGLAGIPEAPSTSERQQSVDPLGAQPSRETVSKSAQSAGTG